MSSVLEMYRQIRAGSIRPTESWDVEQAGISANEGIAQLKEELEKTAQLVEGLAMEKQKFIEEFTREQIKAHDALDLISTVQDVLSNISWGERKVQIEKCLTLIKDTKRCWLNSEE